MSSKVVCIGGPWDHQLVATKKYRFEVVVDAQLPLNDTFNNFEVARQYVQYRLETFQEAGTSWCLYAAESRRGRILEALLDYYALKPEDDRSQLREELTSANYEINRLKQEYHRLRQEHLRSQSGIID